MRLRHTLLLLFGFLCIASCWGAIDYGFNYALRPVTVGRGASPGSSGFLSQPFTISWDGRVSDFAYNDYNDFPKVAWWKVATVNRATSPVDGSPFVTISYISDGSTPSCNLTMPSVYTEGHSVCNSGAALNNDAIDMLRDNWWVLEESINRPGQYLIKFVASCGGACRTYYYLQRDSRAYGRDAIQNMDSFYWEFWPICPPGRFIDVNTKTCMSCPAGYYSEEYGTSTCAKCGEGSGSAPGSRTCRAVMKSGMGAAFGLWVDRTDVFLRSNTRQASQIYQLGTGAVSFYDNVLGGDVASAPAAVNTPTTMAGNVLSVFATGSNNGVWRMRWEAGDPRWKGWTHVGTSTVNAPAVASWGTNRIDLFVTGVEGNLYHKFSNNPSQDTWTPDGETNWEGFGAPPGLWLISAPAAAGWIKNGITHLKVFAVAADRALWGIDWDSNSGWGSWYSLGGVCTSAPGAAAYLDNQSVARVVVMTLNTGSTISQREWSDQANNWMNWASPRPLGQTINGMSMASAPAITVDANKNRLVFVKASDGRIYRYAPGVSANWVAMGTWTFNYPLIFLCGASRDLNVET